MKVMLGTRYYPKTAGALLLALVLAAAITGCTLSCIPYPGPSLDLEIRTWYDLDAVRNNLAGHHRVMNSLNAATPGYDELAGPTADEGRGWEPIGTWDPFDHNLYLAFTGTFDGQGFIICDLFIMRPGRKAGLFGYVGGAAVHNLGIVDADVTGDMAGALIAHNDMGTVANCYSTGTVEGNNRVGGLVGWNTGGGGITDCYSTVSIMGGVDGVGGLVGRNSGIIEGCYHEGSVRGNSAVGGLVGDNRGDVSNSYSSGAVTGVISVGGLVGQHRHRGSVSNSHSTGSVTGSLSVGGLVGSVSGAAITNAYSAGNVTGRHQVGGLVGYNDDGTVTNSFWDVETSGMEESDGGTGKTTAEMMGIATFTDMATEGLDEPWDMVVVSPGESDGDHIWNIVDGETYPFLSWEAVHDRLIMLDETDGTGGGRTRR